MTGFQIGDTVHTASGRVYFVKTFFTSSRVGPSATLAPLKAGPPRHSTSAALSSLTLIRTSQLTLAFRHADKAQHPDAQPWQRAAAAARAAHWLTQAELRGDDSRAALNLGTDRILDLEVDAA